MRAWQRIGVAIGLASALAAPAGAQDSAWVQLFPELRRLPAPAWVQPGTRIVYRSLAATLGGDPNQTNPSGGGYTVVDVLALDGQRSVMSVSSFSGSGNVMVPLAASAGLGLPGCGGDWWLNPAVLPGAPAKAEGDVQIVKMPYSVGGQSFTAMRFQYEKPDSRLVWMYDMQSGVLLTSNSRVGPAEGKRTQTDAQLAGLRKVNVPWAAAAPPDWVAGWQGLRGQGTYTVQIPGSPAYPIPVQIAAQRRDGGPAWLVYDLQTTMGGLGGMPPQVNTAQLATGNAQIGGLWIPPSAIRNLQAGQVLDQDPILRVQRDVEAANGQQVVIRESGQGYQVEMAYEAAGGHLVRLRRMDRTGVAVTVLDLQFQ